jgi:hypothetical protein
MFWWVRSVNPSGKGVRGSPCDSYEHIHKRSSEELGSPVRTASIEGVTAPRTKNSRVLLVVG